MIAPFSAADQLRRRPAPVNTSMRRTGSGICLCSEIDMCRSLLGSDNHPSAAGSKGGGGTSLTFKLSQLCFQIAYTLQQRELVIGPKVRFAGRRGLFPATR